MSVESKELRAQAIELNDKIIDLFRNNPTDNHTLVLISALGYALGNVALSSKKDGVDNLDAVKEVQKHLNNFIDV